MLWGKIFTLFKIHYSFLLFFYFFLILQLLVSFIYLLTCLLFMHFFCLLIYSCVAMVVARFRWHGCSHPDVLSKIYLLPPQRFRCNCTVFVIISLPLPPTRISFLHRQSDHHWCSGNRSSFCFSPLRVALTAEVQLQFRFSILVSWIIIFLAVLAFAIKPASRQCILL